MWEVPGDTVEMPDGTWEENPPLWQNAAEAYWPNSVGPPHSWTCPLCRSCGPMGPRPAPTKEYGHTFHPLTVWCKVPWGQDFRHLLGQRIDFPFLPDGVRAEDFDSRFHRLRWEVIGKPGHGQKRKQPGHGPIQPKGKGKGRHAHGRDARTKKREANIRDVMDAVLQAYFKDPGHGPSSSTGRPGRVNPFERSALSALSGVFSRIWSLRALRRVLEKPKYLSLRQDESRPPSERASS